MKKLFISTLIAFMAVFSTQSVFAANFVSGDISGDIGVTFSTIAFDADSDGDLDLYVSNNNEQNKLWINDGTGNFTNNDITGDIGATFSTIAFDADGDGDLDLYVSNRLGEQNRLWINDGTGNFSSADIAGDLGDTNASAIAFDADGDADLDLYVSNRLGEQNRLFINDGSGNFSSADITGDLGDTNAPATTFDADADGDLDLYIPNNNEQNKLWINDGTGNFTNNDITGDTGATFTTAIALDADSDGNLDLYVPNISQQNRLFINDGLGNFSSADITGDLGFTSTPATAFDADTDGDLDLYVPNINQQNRLFINDGSGNFTNNDITGDIGNSTSSTAFDADGDGDLDLYVTSTSGQQNRLWINDGSGNFSSADIAGDTGATFAAIVFDADSDADLDLYVSNINQQNRLWINQPLPVITITQPTTINNASITDTTIQVTDPTGTIGVLAADVSVGVSSTATTSALNCTQTDAHTVDCTISIDSSGSITIEATNANGTRSAIQGGYIVDLVPPQVPSVNIDTTAGVNTPTLTYSSFDNIAVDYFEIIFTADNGGAGVSGTTTTLSPAPSPQTLTLDADALTIAPFVHEVTVRVYDTAGNFSENILRFPPIVTFTTPTLVNNTTITDAMVTITSPQDNDITNILLTDGGTGATLGTCTGDNTDTTDPYESPVTCTINNIANSGTIILSGVDSVTGATGNNAQSFVIDTIDPVISITAPTKLNNADITNTTVQVTDNYSINAVDVNLSTINVTGSFSISTQNCIQTTSTQVDCTVTFTGEGTGDLSVSAIDLARNNPSDTETNYEIDLTPPNPTTPNLQDGSDTGLFNNDNVTNDETPTLDLRCDEATSSLILYTDNPIANTSVGIYNCTDTNTFSDTLSTLPDGLHNFTLEETDVAGNSARGSALRVTLDTVITAITIDTPTQGTPVSGTAEPNSTINITTASGASCSTTTDTGGNFNCSLSPTPVHEDDITVQSIDLAGNNNSTTVIDGIDTLVPQTPIIDPVSPSDTTITGTGEDGTTITLDISPCTNAPVIVAGGVWSCDILTTATPRRGDRIVATSTDTAGNFSTGSYTIPRSGGSGGSGRRSVCKDPEAINYDEDSFARHKQSKCEYEETSASSQESTPTESNPFGGEQCPANLIVTDNMKVGDRNGKYSSYNQGTVTQVDILQTHMNRLLLDQYGNQASGPVDGIFGPLTKRGVERLQMRLNQLLPDMTPLVIDGIVGPFTKAAINNSCVSVFEPVLNTNEAISTNTSTSVDTNLIRNLIERLRALL